MWISRVLSPTVAPAYLPAKGLRLAQSPDRGKDDAHLPLQDGLSLLKGLGEGRACLASEVTHLLADEGQLPQLSAPLTVSGHTPRHPRSKVGNCNMVMSTHCLYFLTNTYQQMYGINNYKCLLKIVMQAMQNKLFFFLSKTQ